MSKFTFTEDDAGTKRRTKEALKKTKEELDKEFREAMMKYWYRVWEVARQLCIEYGAVDTWALYESIRLVWDASPIGGLYEVIVSAEGVDMTALIKVGGVGINWKTGRVVDYAQAVHDGHMSRGGEWVRARPFLMDAITICEPYRMMLMKQHVDRALSKFERSQ